MSANQQVEAPTWYDHILQLQFSGTIANVALSPESGVMALVTDLMVSNVSGASGDGFIISNFSTGVIFFQAERGAGAHDCFQLHGHFPFHPSDRLSFQASGSSVWTVWMDGLWYPDYSAELI